MARGSARLLMLGVILLALLVSASSGGAASSRHRGPFIGLGTWVDIYGAEWANPEAAVAAMAKHHVKTLYLETGNYSHAASVYRPDRAGRFIDAAHAAGMQVVAWYLPAFRYIKIDARKALGAINFHSATGQRFDGFALDIEATKVRSLKLRDQRLLQLSARLRNAVPGKYKLGAITPSPIGMSPTYWPDIPYRSLTRYYDSFLPMAYFTMRGIYGRAATRNYLVQTVSAIRAASGNPTFPMHIIGGLSGSMNWKHTAGFMQAVARTKPRGYSLYAFGQTTPGMWRALDPHS